MQKYYNPDISISSEKKVQNDKVEKSKEKKAIYIIDITEEIRSVVHQLAEEVTAKYINSLRERKSWFGKIIGGIKSSFAELSRSYIYHQYRKQIEKEINENYNIFQRIAIEGNKVNIDERDLERMSEFLRLAIERFETQVADRFSRNIEIGKKIESNDLTEIKNLVAEIVRDFITQPGLDTPEGRIKFNQEFSRRLKSLIAQNKLSPDLFHGEADQRIADSPEHFSTNIYDYTINLKRELENISQENNLTPEQNEKLKEYIQSVVQIDIQLGKLVSSIRTKIPDVGKKGTSDYTLSSIEKLCLSLENVPILNKLINPITVGLATGILSKEGLIKIGGRSLTAAAGASVIGSLGYLSLPIITGSVLAGVFSYFRSKARIKQDVGRILREQAAGLEITDKRAQQILERIALPGGEDFRKNINELMEGIKKKDKNSYIEAVARLELEYETRTPEVENLPQLDLLISSGMWRSSYIERYELEKAILELESEMTSEEKEQLRQTINNKKQELINNIKSQDQKIKQESRKIAIRNGVITGVAAFVIGSTVQYLRDLFGETELGERLSKHPLGAILATPKAKEKISLIEFLLGERPRTGKEGYTLIDINGEKFNIPYSQKEVVEKVITLPEEGINSYGTIKWDPESQQWILGLTEEAKKSGWTVTKDGFSLKKEGIQAHLIENWSEVKDFLSRNGYQTRHINWTDFAYETNPPKVSSWEVPPDHPGFQSEGLELTLSYKKAPDGSVVIRVPVKGIAFKPGKEWNIEEFVNNGRAAIALSPRDRVLQHSAIVFSIKPEYIKGSYAEIPISKELADIFFYEDSNRLRLNSAQITYNLFLDDEHAVSIAADYNTENKNIIIPPIEKNIPVKIIENPPEPPLELDPPIPIPILIEWKTPKPGEYSKKPKTPSTQIPPDQAKTEKPEGQVMPYYYTSSYLTTLDWEKRFSLDKELTEDDKQSLKILKQKFLKLNTDYKSIQSELKVKKEKLENEKKKNEKLGTKSQELEELEKEIEKLNQKMNEVANELRITRESMITTNLKIERKLINKYFENIDNIFDSVFDKRIIQNLFQLNNYQGESYKGFIEHLIKTQNVPEMENNCKVSIFIPAYMEEKNIYRTLEKYTQQVDNKNQPLDSSLYEIVILVNKRENEDWDKTQEEIKRFKKKHPNFKIHMIKCNFPKEIASVGLARRILTDIILFRANQREKQNSPLYLITEDADLEEVDQKIVYKTIERFEKYPWLDALRGVQVRNPEILTKNHMLWLSRTGAQILEHLMRSRKGLPKEWYYKAEPWPDPFSWARIITGGWCTSISASALALIGGYDPRMRIGEDLFIGNAISIVRSEEKDNNEKPIPNTKTISTMSVAHISSMRRFMNEFFKNIYGEFGDPNLERLIRTVDENDILKQLIEVEKTKGTKKIFENIINSHIGTLINLTSPNIEEGQRRGELYLTLFHLRKNIDYRWKNDKEIELLDSSLKRIKFLFKLFNLFVEKYGTKELIKRKLGVWPIWAGFKVPIQEKGTFELIEIINTQLPQDLQEKIDKNMSVEKLADTENKVIDKFMSLSHNTQLTIVQKIVESRSK